MKWFHVTKSKVTDQTYVFYLSEYIERPNSRKYAYIRFLSE